MSKKKSYAIERRSIRRKENAVMRDKHVSIKGDIMMGRAAQRGWGSGKVKE